MLKSPDRTNPQREVLEAVALIAIVQILEPRVDRAVLTRTPVKAASKPGKQRARVIALNCLVGNGCGLRTGVLTQLIQFIL